MSKQQAIAIPAERIERAILLIRGQRVMLDADLAVMYGVSTKRLNQQFSRNRDRFPEDFAFQLTQKEFDVLRSQFATSSYAWGGRRYRPFAFTEHGALMLANVLNSDVAVTASVEIVRAFVRLQELLATHKDLARRVDELEERYDGQFTVVFDALRKLMAVPKTAKTKQMGFHTLVPKRHKRKLQEDGK